MKILIETDSFIFKVGVVLCATIIGGVGYIYNDDKKQFTARNDHIVKQLAEQNRYTSEHFDKLHLYNREHEKQVAKINQNISTLNESVSMVKRMQFSQIPKDR